MTRSSMVRAALLCDGGGRPNAVGRLRFAARCQKRAIPTVKHAVAEVEVEFRSRRGGR